MWEHPQDTLGITKGADVTHNAIVKFTALTRASNLQVQHSVPAALLAFLWDVRRPMRHKTGCAVAYVCSDHVVLEQSAVIS